MKWDKKGLFTAVVAAVLAFAVRGEVKRILEPLKPGEIVARGGRKGLRIVGPLATAVTGRKTVSVRLEGVSAATVATGVLSCGDVNVASLSPARPDALVFDVPSCGLYTLEAAAVGSDGVTNATAVTTFAVVPAISERPRELGVCTHFAHGKGAYPLTFDLLRLMGVSRIRDDLAWKAVEHRPGGYAIPGFADHLVSRCEEYGITPLFVFGYPNGKCYPGGFKGKPFPTDDDTRKACADALAFAVKHYGRRVPAWELWNEPNYAHPVKDYLPLLKFVYPAVKTSCPDVKLISGGGSGAGGGPGGTFINPIFGAKGQDLQDGWSIHPYMSPNTPDHGYFCDWPPFGKEVGSAVNVEYSSRYLLGRAAKCLRSDGKALELWITEIGWTCAKVNDEQQAAYITRALLLYRRHAPGVPVFLYDFQNDGTKPDDIEHNFGLIRKDFSPKPSFQAVAVAASLLANRPFTDALMDGDDCRIYGYGSGGKADVYAAWNVGKSWKNREAPSAREVQVALPAGNWKLIDWQGRPQPFVRTPDGRVTLNLSDRPSWLVRAE